MKTAILYLSKHGTTEKVARIIGDMLKEKDTELINLEKAQPSLDQYDRIIIGGPVYAGTVNKKLTSYCIENETLLAQKQLGLFVCGMEPDPDKQQTELETAFPKSLQGKAKATGFMGGEFILEKMNFMERFIVKKIAHTKVSSSNIHEETINLFVEKLKE